MFLEGLPGLPPEREVDLAIEIVHGTAPILAHPTVWLQLN